MSVTKHNDYSNVDWSLSNTEIAKQFNVHKTVIWKARKRRGIPPAFKPGECQKRYLGVKRKPIDDLDYEFAWTIKNGYKNGGRSWHKAVIRNHGSACKICGYDKPEIENDCHHIVPISNGGKNCIRNGTVLCSRCHKEVHANILSLPVFDLE